MAADTKQNDNDIRTTNAIASVVEAMTDLMSQIKAITNERDAALEKVRSLMEECSELRSVIDEIKRCYSSFDNEFALKA